MPESVPSAHTRPSSPTSPAAPVRVIAFMNQKGGVGKTTTTVNLAAGIAALGRRVLVVDLDPQAHASLHLGVDASTLDALPEGQARSAYDVLIDPSVDPRSALRPINENLAVLPAETDLAGVETELADVPPAERTTRLRQALETLTAPGADGQPGFEFVLIDCPPSLGVLTLNGLAAAREVFIPMQAHFLALQGVSKLLETVGLMTKSVNPRLRVTGVILCMHDPASTHTKEVVADMAEFFEQTRKSGQDVPWKSARVLSPPIRRNIKLAECPSFGKSIFDYAPFCPGALDYKALAERVVAEWDALLNRRAEAAAPAPETARTEGAPTSASASTPVAAPTPEANPTPVVKTRSTKARPASTEASV